MLLLVHVLRFGIFFWSSGVEEHHIVRVIAAQGPLWAFGAIFMVYGLDLRSANHCYHLAMDAVTMGHGSNPPVGWVCW
jgi:hypothetical protein